MPGRKQPAHQSETMGIEAYSILFEQHVEETRNHQMGILPDAKSSLTSPPRVGSALWTPAEMDAFFHALAIHSRLRPDLIASCVETKNILEVMEYLHLLEKGSRSCKREHACGVGLPMAHEMSDCWITWEERSAENLLAKDWGDEGRPPGKPKGVGLMRNSCGKRNSTISTIDTGGKCSTASRLLSPISRRRYQKRMCMRRRRAKERGEEVNTTPSLLNPGRRRKNREKASFWHSKNNTAIPSNAGPDVSPGDETSSSPLLCQQDQPLPTQSNSSDEERLQFFHTHNLCGVMRSLFLSLGSSLPDNRDQPIDLEVLDILYELTRDFLFEIIGRIIILEEEQRKIKGEIKAWRKTNIESGVITVKRASVLRTLKSMGIPKTSKAQYFKQLLRKFDVGDVDDASSSENNREPIRPAFSIRPCFVDYRDSIYPLGHVDANASVSPEDQYEEDCAIHDDELLDQEDSLADQAYEASLWKEVCSIARNL